MNKLQNIIIAFFGIALLTSCNSDHNSTNISLNNGEKWEVNDEMKPHIERGKELVDEYKAQNDGDYQKLAENLKAQNSELIQSCTMKGESHDELHNWLHPHMQLIDSLSKANSEEEAKEIVSEIDKSFSTYQNYFE